MPAINTTDTAFSKLDGSLMMYVRDGNNFIGTTDPESVYDIGTSGAPVSVRLNPFYIPPKYKKTFTTDDRYTDGWEPYTPWQGTNGLISGGYWTGDGVNPAIGIKRPGSWDNGFVEFSVSLGGPKEGWDNMSAWIASNVISGARVGSIDVRNYGNNLLVTVKSGNVLNQDLFLSWIPYVDNDPIILRIEMVPLLNGTSEVRYKKDGVTLATEITSNAFIDPQVGFFTEILAGQQNKVDYVDYVFNAA